MRDLKLS